MILDGKVFTADACAGTAESAKGGEISLWYSGKTRSYGASVQAVMASGGLPLWAGPAEPGSVPDTDAARVHALPAVYRAAARGLPALADGGYQGAGIGIKTPMKNPKQKRGRRPGNSTRTSAPATCCCAGCAAGANAGLPCSPALQHVTASPGRTTQIIRAALVLTHWEHKYLQQIL